MTRSLKQSGISGAKWTGLYHIGHYFITFFLSIVLARLLEPKEFGLVGMLSIFSAIALVFINSGFSVALVRAKETTKEDYSTVFLFNVLVSLFFYFLLFFAAPYIANFYKEPQLVLLTRLISLVFVINAFGLVQTVIMIRALNFKKQSICSLIGLLASVILAIFMAFKGYGVYSIVGQVISQAIVTTILFWFLSDWRPNAIFSKKSFKKLWGFSSKILATNIVNTIINNIDNLLIGKIFSANQLGFYVKAKSSKTIPVQIFTQVLNSTSFAILSKVQDDDNEFLRLHLYFFKIVAYVFIPVTFGFIAIAEPFVVILYSDKWLPSVPLLQILSLSGFSIVFGALFSQTLMAKGYGSLYFRLNTIKKIIGLLAIPFGLFWGLLPFIWAIVIFGFIGLLLDFIYVGRKIGVKSFDYLYFFLKPLFLSVFMAFSIYLFKYIISNYYFLIMLQISIGIAIYALLSVIFRVREFFTVKTIIMEQIVSMKSRIFKR
jgi:teichuronic acid exporter